MSTNGDYDGNNDLLRQEFYAMVAAVVDEVQRQATNTVQQAAGTVAQIGDHLQGAIGDIRNRAEALQQTASQARDALTPITQTSWQIESLNRSFTQRVTELSQRLDALQSQVNGASNQTVAMRNQIQAMDQSWRQLLADSEKRKKRFFLTVGMFLIGSGIVLWAAFGMALIFRFFRGGG